MTFPHIQTKPGRLFLWLALPAMLLVQGCGVYSFTGANLPPDIKTISITNFVNNAGNGPSYLGQNFTEKARSYYQQNSSLSILTTGTGDLKLEGSVIGYTFTPVAPTASAPGKPAATTSLTRLTITVKAIFTNSKDKTANFDQNFSYFADYPAGNNITAIEAQLIDDITDQIIFDIFNKSISNW